MLSIEDCYLLSDLTVPTGGTLCINEKIAAFDRSYIRISVSPVGAAERCDLLILLAARSSKLLAAFM
jgi:hypothetical protein